MRPIPASFTWKNKWFVFRLFVSYLVVPTVPGVLWQLALTGGRGWILRGQLDLIRFYGAISLAAMLILGTPLLAVYLWLGWTDFISFMAGGGVCAGITACAACGGLVPWCIPLGLVFAPSGIISGAVFRLILFGAQTYHPAPNQGVSK